MNVRGDIEKKVVLAVQEFARSINPRSKIVSDMSRLIDVTNELPLSGLNDWERLIRFEFDKSQDLSTKANWKFWDKPSKILTWLDLISRDGHKREMTLRTLSGAAPNSFFFALAVRRLNDWVPQVREATREKLPLIVEVSDPKHIAEALCTILSNWSSWGRMEQLDKDVLLKIISNEKIGKELKARVISSSSGPMVSIMSQIGRTSVLDNDLNEIAECAVQPSVRSKAYRSLLEDRLVWFEGRKFEWTDIRYCEGRLKPIIGERKLSKAINVKELIAKSAKDTSSIVRRVAAEFLIRELTNMGDESIQLANLFASDKSPAVSERGKFALKKLEEAKDSKNLKMSE